MRQLDHERLHVYQRSLDFLARADAVVAALPRGHGYLVDQLYRAATSISLNIAEGAGEFSVHDKARFYRMARRSAAECAAILDVCRRLRLSNVEDLAGSRELLLEIVAMLTVLVRGKSRAARNGTQPDGINPRGRAELIAPFPVLPLPPFGRTRFIGSGQGQVQGACSEGGRREMS